MDARCLGLVTFLILEYRSSLSKSAEKNVLAIILNAFFWPPYNYMTPKFWRVKEKNTKFIWNKSRKLFSLTILHEASAGLRVKMKARQYYVSLRLLWTRSFIFIKSPVVVAFYGDSLFWQLTFFYSFVLIKLRNNDMSRTGTRNCVQTEVWKLEEKNI